VRPKIGSMTNERMRRSFGVLFMIVTADATHLFNDSLYKCMDVHVSIEFIQSRTTGLPCIENMRLTGGTSNYHVRLVQLLVACFCACPVHSFCLILPPAIAARQPSEPYQFRHRYGGSRHRDAYPQLNPLPTTATRGVIAAASRTDILLPGYSRRKSRNTLLKTITTICGGSISPEENEKPTPPALPLHKKIRQFASKNFFLVGMFVAVGLARLFPTVSSK